MSFSPLSPGNSDSEPANFDLYALRQKFCQLFPHGWDFILKETPESNWKTIKKYKLTEQKLWYKYTDPEKILGLRFGTSTRHGLGDIDLGSIHDPRVQEESLNKLKDELEKWGITRIFFLQSSFNGGLHFYLFLDRLINTFRLACVLNKVIEDAGLEIKRGQLETFPNTKRYNSLFKRLKLLPSLDCQKTVHTLPLMKGVMPHIVIVIEFLDRVFQRAYYNALMRIPRLELLYQGFGGRGTGGLVQRKGESQSQLQSILPNTEVEIL